MRTVSILMTVCILISSCSLFKKTTKEKFELRQGYELDSSSFQKNVFNDLSHSGARISDFNLTRNLSSKTLKADRIRINPDGSLEAVGNAQYTGFDENENASLEEEENFLNSNIYYANEAEGRIKKEESLKVKESETKSEVSGRGIFYVCLIVGVVFLIICFIIIVYKKMWIV